MAPLFGNDDNMKEIGKNMQNLSEQIGTLKQQLAERNSQVEQLQSRLNSTESQVNSQSDVAAQQLMSAQAQVHALQQQIGELQKQIQQPAQVQQPAATQPTSGQKSGSSLTPQSVPSQQPAAPAQGGLAVGSSAWVTQAGGLPLRLRSQPGLAKDSVIDRLPPGTQMTLLEGPQSRDNHAWWRIRTTDGREGWVAGEDLRTQPD